ncbi:MAG: GMC family oxidoreductase [Deltaproteobacteria bacterium]|nr:GMC family oxidoreductase [Deltaproteobacteria bacterium]MBW2418805.1 GMC family oxidoreductase [Deltaproteobacteria bacterium]
MIQQLSEAGFEVVALERGPEIESSRFSEDELEVVVRDRLFSPHQLETYRADAESPAVPGRYNATADCLGGSMTLWSGWSWRLRPDEFKVRDVEGRVDDASLANWPIGYEELEPWYEQAEQDFAVAGAAGRNPFEAPRKRGYPLPPHPARRAGELFEQGAVKAGLTPFPLPVAINSKPHAGRPRCLYGGACTGFGCEVHAKSTSLAVCLPRARKTKKLDLRTDAEVFEIVVGSDGRAKGARYFDAEGATHEVLARQVVVACNAVGSARLLLLSTSKRFPDGLANSSGLVGRNLMLHHSALVRCLVDGPTRAVTGIEATRAVDDWHPSDDGRGFIRGGVVAEVSAFTRQPIVYALTEPSRRGGAPRWGHKFKRYLRDFPRTMVIGSVLEDLPVESNRIDLDPGVKDRFDLPVPRITRRQHANDIAMNRWFRARLLELAASCGGRDATSFEMPGVAYVDENDAVKGSAHLMGTCRMGEHAQFSVLDRWCRAHDVPNLWVVDGSCFPTSAGYNPTLTILANAYRVANRLIVEARRMNL